MTSKGFLFLLFAMILALAVSCEKSPDPAGPAEPDTKLEDRLVVSYDETRTASEVASFRETPWHSIFDRLLEEKGYQVWSGDAAHFKAVDPATGKIGHMTLIPCSVPGDDSRVAIIEYFRGDEGCAVTAAEYYECEEYQIAHPIDERTGLSMLGDEASQGLKLELIERSEASKRYWRCVTGRFVAGCSGCATVCWITGPAWGPCTAKCCTGSLVVAMISCAFTVYMGW
jgi:hypothetical protein